MTEAEARDWIRERFGVPRETRLSEFSEILCGEAARQNLIAPSTLPLIWSRHIVDSAQLIPLANGADAGEWIDVGSGAGLPGIVVAVLTDRPVVLVEPRTKRAAFLGSAAKALGLEKRVSVISTKVEAFRCTTPATVISARAVAALPDLIRTAIHCSNLSTLWLLPKGRNAQSEVAEAQRTWQGVFHVEPSVTQPDSGIVVARRVQPR